ncbi:hypothetical protein A3B56_01010 [Candidatus Roizmanbacteria bacterium RIFCSPLOWO2_01_FULL_45_11]|uniref:Uncharacterized protein n=1 Tax=Candidatus Roizmanbacteria bacterium RIFCSPLOWO2_01_FULL_45_11 TaxID=1802070 RepID=A0A1F7JIC5_9BACT|nr:MAG: hypothetical protein A3B56_01010 [Candidatus Roizmanbacteria bacterium RIFCSPLOWO2_01_FULL_45_11]
MKHTTLFGLHDKDIMHHILLAIILFVGLLSVWGLANKPGLQFTVGTLTACAYVGWGAFHHYHDGDLHAKNMVEYVLLALLGIMVLAFIFL